MWLNFQTLLVKCVSSHFLKVMLRENKYELICDGNKKSSPSVFAPMYFYEPMIHRLMKDDDDYYKMFFLKAHLDLF